MPQRYVLPLLALSVLLLLLASGGCVNTSIGTKHIESTAALPTNDLLREAELAFASQRFPTSELYYSRLSARPDLPAEERALVYQRLTASAVHADHFNSAFTALNKWVETDPAAVDNADYFALSMEIYHRLNLEGAMAQLTDRLVNDSAMDWDVRASGGVALARMHFADGEDAQALKVLGGFYSMAPDRDGRAALERAFLRQLRDDPWDSDLVELTTPKNHTFFPYALIAFEDARRLAGEDKTWAASWKTMRQVVSEANLADKSHLGDILIALEREHGQPTLAVALALPLSGRYQAVGQKVASGVAAAQWMLANSGVEVEVKVINTDAPGWTARIASLPPHFAMVGGPLEVSNFREIEASGAMAGRAFFTFLPSLGDGQEGTQAWRFFPSR
ncbi:MAG: hypothetical protein KKB70_01865, partial [Proteobacteria bacterium]|nr:hypothetical protein [Pseudomonadota bacterium]